MASTDDFEVERPTDEELDALRDRDDVSGSTTRESPRAPREPLRVLVVSRRDDDLKTLSALLGENRVDLSLARNPFTALDYLRARDFQVLITESSMWADRGALLFERLELLDRRVQVVLIVERDEVYSWDQDRRVDALLERPLDPERSRRSIAELCARWRHSRRGGSPGPEPREPQSNEEGAAAAPAERDGDELASWYGFFFDMRRRSRLARDRDDRREIFLQSLLRITGARGVGLLISREAEWSEREEVSHVDVRLAMAADAGEEGVRRELLRVFAEIPEDLDAALGASGEPRALVLPILLPEGVAWLVAIPREKARLAPIPEDVLEELPYLILEVIGAADTRSPGKRPDA